MAYRKVILANQETYHIFNRGVAKTPIFRNAWDYQRFTYLIDYYRFQKLPLRFSYFHRLPKKDKDSLWKNIVKNSSQLIEINAYCLMPNHLHIMVKQLSNNGISKFMANLLNSYARFFNTKYKRIGPLYQSNFKAVRIETEEQLLHVQRYIHLNPVSSYIIEKEQIEKYRWSSLPHYSNINKSPFISSGMILNQFKSTDSYKKFILDQADYQRKLGDIKHLALEK